MDIQTPANCTGFNLRKATRAVTQIYDDALRPSGLRATQFTLLAVTAQRGPLNISDLAKALVMDRTTLTRNLKPLAAKGLVRIESGADARVREVALTAEGRRTLDEILPLWTQAQSHVVDKIGEQRWASLVENLRATVEAVQTE